MLYEETDNEASGSTEALAVILIKYNFKSIKSTVNTAILKIEQKIQSHIHKPSQTLPREACFETRNRLGLNNI